MNSVITFAFDAIFKPFEGLSPWWGLVFISAVSGVGLLWVFKLTSNQKAIKEIKRRISGGFIEIRLFQDDPGIMFRALGRILSANMVYLRYSLVPLVFMMIPVIVLLVHSNGRYGLRPVLPGEKVIVTAVADSRVNLDSLRLELPEGVKLVTPAVRIVSSGEVSWAVMAGEKGDYKLTIRSGDTTVDRRLLCDTRVRGVSPARISGGAYDVFVNPGYPPVDPASGIKEFAVNYPKRIMSLAGADIHWIIIYFVLSLIFGYSVKGVLKVQI